MAIKYGKKLTKILEFNTTLAEIVGIVLGDGGIYQYYYNKQRCFVIINFNKQETEYMLYVKKIFSKYFHPYSFSTKEIQSEYQLQNGSVFVCQFLVRAGLKTGNKVMNNVKIPLWILRKDLLKYVVRGLFDTDGCVYRKYDNYAQIQFKFGCLSLTKSLRTALILLNFHPTRIQKSINNKNYFDWKFYLSRQEEIARFFTEIDPKNPKHVRRYKQIKSGNAAI